MSQPSGMSSVFEATRQFVVLPDKRYQVELRDSRLCFRRTGSQFDSKWVVRGAKSVLGEKLSGRIERLSPTAMLCWGLGLSVLSALLLFDFGMRVAPGSVAIRPMQWNGVGVLGLAFIVGLVMIIGGIFSRKKGDERTDFQLDLAEIAEATLRPVQSELARRGEPQVARIQILPRSGKNINLSIPTAGDLETAKSVIPALR